MRLVTSINGLLRTIDSASLEFADGKRKVSTGLACLDGLAPGRGFVLGAVHEFLGPTDTPASLVPLLVARAAAQIGWIVWCDPLKRFYPPAAASFGLPLERLILLRPPDEAALNWSVTECLRCRGVAACVAWMGRLSFLHARRFQLAAERGGGMGLILRPGQAATQPYAAATRWMVRPASGERSLQRLVVELIHGHGGRVGERALLEV